MKYLKNVASLVYEAEKCTGCGRCVEVCPHGVFVMRDKRAGITDADFCMECGACDRNCRFGAIKVNSGVGCAAAIIGGMLTGGEPVCGCDGKSGPSC
ncbi:MAG TPA: mercury methylation ferredoxin HgcB [Spirochaetota bacterium]|nr:mercury methylation ferredoxin HgcB [Spirochaetota bacterium]